MGKLFFRLDCHKPTTLVFGLLLNDGWRDRGSTTIVCRVSPGRRMCTSNVYHLSPWPRVGLSLLEGSRSRGRLRRISKVEVGSREFRPVRLRSEFGGWIERVLIRDGGTLDQGEDSKLKDLVSNER